MARFVGICEERRLELGLTLTEVATRAHLSPRTLGLMRGSAVEPTLSTLFALAAALDLKLDIRLKGPRVEVMEGRAGRPGGE